MEDDERLLDSFLGCEKYQQDGVSIYFVGARDLLKIKQMAKETCPERAEKEANDIAFLENLLHE